MILLIKTITAKSAVIYYNVEVVTNVGYPEYEYFLEKVFDDLNSSKI